MSELKNDHWLQALGLLFQACEPLTFDCDCSDQEIKDQRAKITHYAFYCQHVKGAIEDGITPLSFDIWDEKAKNFSVNASAAIHPGFFCERMISNEFRFV